MDGHFQYLYEVFHNIDGSRIRCSCDESLVRAKDPKATFDKNLIANAVGVADLPDIHAPSDIGDASWHPARVMAITRATQCGQPIFYGI